MKFTPTLIMGMLETALPRSILCNLHLYKSFLGKTSYLVLNNGYLNYTSQSFHKVKRKSYEQ